MFSVLSASPARSPPSSLSVPTENGSGGVDWKRSLSGPRMSEPMPLSYVTSQEMRCLLHWLSDWSPAQREQFVHSLAEKAVPWKVLSLLDGLAGLSVESGKPPSIFECQMRLWDQWFRGWSQEERNEFVRQLEEVMPDIASRLYQEIAATAGQD